MKAVATGTQGNQRMERVKHFFIWLILLVELVPLYYMLQISLKDNRAFYQNPWLPVSFGDCQWSNWVYGFQLMMPTIINSVFVAFGGTLVSLSLALMGAYFFARYKMPFSNLLWMVFLTLMMMPGIANLIPLFQLLKTMNLLNTLWALVIVGAAGSQVFNIFVLRNFIEDIPRDLLEAAEIDGAGHLQQIRHVIIPTCAPILSTLFVLAFLGKWNDFMLPLVVLRDPELFPIGVQLIYLDGEYVKEFGKMMAAFSVASIPLLIVFVFSMKHFVEGLSSGAFRNK